ncbi:MAG: hypothetical protein JWN43_2401 [Gammaproteobacteria bacterium]|nr:hypothetical protein [Gammaproteobacteria bacterium]
MDLSKEQLSQVIADSTWVAISHAIQNGNLKQFLENLQVNIRRREARDHVNPLVRKGAKYFSQNDEDGILLDIIRRCGIQRGTFIECGVGDGLENNTIILLMNRWKGCWFGGQQLAFSFGSSENLFFKQMWINAEEALNIYRSATDFLKVDDVDLLSIDLDGIDIYVVEKILQSGARPKVFICEYNAKFPPPIEFKVPYDPNFRWDGAGDYSAASLQTYANLMTGNGYTLVACNITGSNAFFVRDDYRSKFSDVPAAIVELYAPPNDGLLYTVNHRASPRTILSFINGEQGK